MTDGLKEQIMLDLLEAIHTQVKYNYLINTLYTLLCRGSQARFISESPSA